MRTRPILPAIVLAAAAAVPCAARLEAQADPARIYAYRYVLDVDVPEAAALVALDETPLHVLRASAPKPLAVTVLDARRGGPSRRGAAVEVSPYFAAGGGHRALASYRDMSQRGRWMRVLTKTVVSLAAVEDPYDPDALGLGIGVRATLHDPHDPIGNTRMVEEMAAASPGADLRPTYRAALRRVRGRCCVQVSAGWGMAGRLLHGDSLRRVRHTAWLAGQFTLGERLDVLTTVQGRSVFHPDRALRAGAALQGKTRDADLFAELFFDTGDHRLHPGVGAELRPVPRLGVVAALASDAPPAGLPGKPTLRFRTLLRWYYARRG